MWKKEHIPDDSSLFRHVHKTNMDKRNRRIPSESNFSIKKGDEGLSVDWDKYTTPGKIFARISNTYKFGKTEFKDHKDFYIYKLDTRFVRNIPDVRKISHDPLFNGDPASIGNPNNRAHSLVLFDLHNDPEVRTKLRDNALKVNVKDEQVQHHLNEWKRK
ncbi:MAG: hypothetical protein WD607_11515 [Candidatus Paceibacterota bacterium]